ncbi:hypothetical protein HPB47_025310 [Ixodes persulcatus]|uniref:Uncharacterized protein n=1 Tax=Ixodes persulcatus TaxID=34615 RepID=A0AC60Q444_IXOPE|nr:hypothetical protein HPB47_025310 [Ixodes persulcatus]
MKKQLCLLFFRVAEVHKLPHSTTESVFNDFKVTFLDMIRAFAAQIQQNITLESAGNELRVLLACDFLDEIFQAAGSKYQRDHFAKQHLPYVKPEEHVLDVGDTFQYVPITGVLRNLMLSESFCNHLDHDLTAGQSSPLLRSFRDGFFSLMFGDIVPVKNEHWEVYLLLRRIVDMTFADEIPRDHLACLQDEIRFCGIPPAAAAAPRTERSKRSDKSAAQERERLGGRSIWRGLGTVPRGSATLAEKERASAQWGGVGRKTGRPSEARAGASRRGKGKRACYTRLGSGRNDRAVLAGLAHDNPRQHSTSEVQDLRKRRDLAVPAWAMTIPEWLRSETLAVIVRNSYSYTQCWRMGKTIRRSEVRLRARNDGRQLWSAGPDSRLSKTGNRVVQ